MDYQEICKRLGFDPEVGFVKIHPNGEIGFTTGHPEEIKSLLAAVQREGLRPSQGLIDKAARV